MRIVNFTPRTIIIAKLLDDAINNCYYLVGSAIINCGKRGEVDAER